MRIRRCPLFQLIHPRKKATQITLHLLPVLPDAKVLRFVGRTRVFCRCALLVFVLRVCCRRCVECRPRGAVVAKVKEWCTHAPPTGHHLCLSGLCPVVVLRGQVSEVVRMAGGPQVGRQKKSPSCIPLARVTRAFPRVSRQKRRRKVSQQVARSCGRHSLLSSTPRRIDPPPPLFPAPVRTPTR